MAYVKFQRGLKPVRSMIMSFGPSTGARRGKVNFNATIGRLIGELGIAAFTLFYNPATRGFAFRAAKVDDPDAFPIFRPRRNPRTSSGISMSLFLDAAGFTATERVYVPVTWNETELMFEGIFPAINIGEPRNPQFPGVKKNSNQATKRERKDSRREEVKEENLKAS